MSRRAAWSENVRPSLCAHWAHRIIAHPNSARREHFLDHAKAQGKPEIESQTALLMTSAGKR
jgi:hypothetical protein